MAVVRYPHGSRDPAQRRTRGRCRRRRDGSPRLPHVAYDDDGYPYADGAPLAQNSRQCDQIIYAFLALRALLRRRFPGAFAASDMLVYPQKGDLAASVAPDVFVAFGAGDPCAQLLQAVGGRAGCRRSVLEVLSGTTSDNDLGPKRDAYARMGVRELWLFDPFAKRIAGHIAGFRLVDGRIRADRAAAGQGRLPERRARLGTARRRRRSAHPRPGGRRGSARATKRNRPDAWRNVNIGSTNRHGRLDERRGGLAAERQAEEEATARRAAEAEVARLRAALNR